MSTGTSNPENRRAGTNPVATTRPATRNETKRAGTTVSPPAAVEDIRDATEGRAFLKGMPAPVPCRRTGVECFHHAVPTPNLENEGNEQTDLQRNTGRQLPNRRNGGNSD